MSGKGSAPRPYSVPRKVYDNNWDKIFGKKAKDNKENREPKSEDRSNRS
jgi:hypothetical protein